MFRPFHTLRELITYIPTKFRENILSWGRHVPPKRALWRQNSTSGSNFDECHFSRTFLCMILQKIFKLLGTRWVLCDSTFLCLPLNPRCQRHNDTVPSCRPSIAAALLVLKGEKWPIMCRWVKLLWDLFVFYVMLGKHPKRSCLYSCIHRSQMWILVFIIRIDIYKVKQRRRFISRTTATATVPYSVDGLSRQLVKRSAATGKINVLTTNHTATHEICS